MHYHCKEDGNLLIAINFSCSDGALSCPFCRDYTMWSVRGSPRAAPDCSRSVQMKKGNRWDKARREINECGGGHFVWGMKRYCNTFQQLRAADLNETDGLNALSGMEPHANLQADLWPEDNCGAFLIERSQRSSPGLQLRGLHITIHNRLIWAKAS